MFNLYEILRNAQGGHALDNLASQFGLTPEQADAAVKAMVPPLSEEFMKLSLKPNAFGSFLGALGESQHLAAFTDPAAAQAAATAEKGVDGLRQVLGSPGAFEEIARRASSATGFSPELLTQMLPVIASMIFGGITKSLESQGFGTILGQLSKAAGQGGLGPILGQILGGGQAPATAPQPAPSEAAGPGGLGSILGQILAGGRAPTAPGQAPAGGMGNLGGILGTILGSLAGRPGAGASADPAGPGKTAQMPGLDPAAIQASLDALTKMLQPGLPSSPAAPPSRQSGIEEEINNIMSGKHH